MLGYSIAHYAEFYQIKHVLLFGGALAGVGGGRVLDQARATLDAEFGEEFAGINLSMPSETDRRHGQAVAAASLPQLSPVCISSFV